MSQVWSHKGGRHQEKTMITTAYLDLIKYLDLVKDDINAAIPDAAYPQKGKAQTIEERAMKPPDARNTVNIVHGISLRVEPHSVQEDAVISADIACPDGTENINFSFKPDNTSFDKPAKLRVSMDAIGEMGLTQLTLYGPDDEAIQPSIKGNYAIYEIPHFSIYYYRRR